MLLYLQPVLSLWVLHCTIPAIAIASQTCYWPDQSVAKDHIPCNSTTKGTQTSASACCPATSNSYCTDSGLCLTDGFIYRAGCTDITFTAPGCPAVCTNVLKGIRVNIFSCGTAKGNPPFACGNGHGGPDCTSNFTLPPQHIVLRDDQQPGGKDQVNYTDPSAIFVSKASVPLPSTQPSSTYSGSSNGGSSSPSALAVSLGVGLPLLLVLIASLTMNFFQFRHYHINIARYTTDKSSRESSAMKNEGASAVRLVSNRSRGFGELWTDWRGMEPHDDRSRLGRSGGINDTASGQGRGSSRTVAVDEGAGATTTTTDNTTTATRNGEARNQSRSPPEEMTVFPLDRSSPGQEEHYPQPPRIVHELANPAIHSTHGSCTGYGSGDTETDEALIVDGNAGGGGRRVDAGTITNARSVTANGQSRNEKWRDLYE